jgi:hypothetical protein
MTSLASGSVTSAHHSISKLFAYMRADTLEVSAISAMFYLSRTIGSKVTTVNALYYKHELTHFFLLCTAKYAWIHSPGLCLNCRSTFLIVQGKVSQCIFPRKASLKRQPYTTTDRNINALLENITHCWNPFYVLSFSWDAKQCGLIEWYQLFGKSVDSIFTVPLVYSWTWR